MVLETANSEIDIGNLKKSQYLSISASIKILARSWFYLVPNFLKSTILSFIEIGIEGLLVVEIIAGVLFSDWCRLNLTIALVLNAHAKLRRRRSTLSFFVLKFRGKNCLVGKFYLLPRLLPTPFGTTILKPNLEILFWKMTYISTFLQIY